jgi:hypothetical protein
MEGSKGVKPTTLSENVPSKVSASHPELSPLTIKKTAVVAQLPTETES